jgi:hypothetical protein
MAESLSECVTADVHPAPSTAEVQQSAPRPPKRACERSGDASANKAPRTEGTAHVRSSLVIHFIADLLHCAARYGKLGRAVTDEGEQWQQQCVAALSDGVEGMKLILLVRETFPSCALDAGATTKRIYELATDAAATKEDLVYVLNYSPPMVDDARKWNHTAKRMVEVCALWRMNT